MPFNYFLFAVKEGIPTRDELEDLGKQIGEKWEQLGRRLGIEDSELEGISQCYHRLSEKGYQMLKLWKQKEGSAATYQALNCQLRHKLVRRQDLAEKFCCIQGNGCAVYIIKWGYKLG